MGRGRGGYTGKEISYRDSGGKKVKDQNAIFVAEQYMKQGYEVVFRQQHTEEKGGVGGIKTPDLTIKSSDDQKFIKTIEVKGIISGSPSTIAKRIKKASMQFKEGDTENTVAILLVGKNQTKESRKFAREGIAEAKRKNYMKYPVEVWYGDGTMERYDI